jgi:hypothetical protein
VWSQKLVFGVGKFLGVSCLTGKCAAVCLGYCGLGVR